jgi:hypothetical protein
MIRSMPGGVEGVKAMIADFHRRGVRVGRGEGFDDCGWECLFAVVHHCGDEARQVDKIRKG